MKRIGALLLALMTCTGSALGAGVSLDDATDEQKAAAKDKYQAGMSAFEEQKYDDALRSFQESYAMVASPNSHLMVARALARLERLPEAYDEYARVMAEAQAQSGKKYARTASAARNERAELKSRLAFVTPRVDATMMVAGREVDKANVGHSIPVQPGTVEVVLKIGNTETKQQITAEAGRETEVLLAPEIAAGAAAAPSEPCPASQPPTKTESSGIDQRTLALVSGGVGVVGLAAFGVLGALNNSKYDDLKAQCEDGICPSNLAEEGETGRQYQTLANVGLGVGAVGITTGLILWFTAPSDTREEEVGSKGIPQVAVSPRAVSVSGRF